MDINYKIQFFSDWHCGSGLAKGADVDALVIKDKNSLPFVPGKTIKGLLREAVEDILTFRKETNKSVLVALFGNSEDKDNLTNSQKENKVKKGCLFFTNAELDNNQYQAILIKGVVKYLYHSVASTAIGDNGIAKDYSLRKMEVVVPCTLYGKIVDVPEENKEIIMEGLQFIKRLGQNRNRGLGRCQFTEIEEKGDKQ